MNSDYIRMLNVPDFSPSVPGLDFSQNDLDLWLNTDFNVDAESAALAGRGYQSVADFNGQSQRTYSDQIPFDNVAVQDFRNFLTPNTPAPQTTFLFPHQLQEQPQYVYADTPAHAQAVQPQPSQDVYTTLNVEQSQFNPMLDVLGQLNARNAALQTPIAFPLDQFVPNVAPAKLTETAAAAEPIVQHSASASLAWTPAPLVPAQLPGTATKTVLIAPAPSASQFSLEKVDLPNEPVATPQSSSTTSVPSQSQFAAPAESVSGDNPKTESEQEKRRRNTAASARFRAKRKIRDQTLEKTAREMTDKAQLLERRLRECEMEVKWLRQLVTQQDDPSAGKKRLRDLYEENGLVFYEGTTATGCGIEAPSQSADGSDNNLAAAAAAFAGVMALAAQSQTKATGKPAEKKRRIAVKAD
ncbi:uncharacterized protein EV422DRAFT_40550 [Fimicolochytrium jonesii]|uniref:uncharacterized protein n=1 Tax=Fimicolochytrium jonesii TaxID=1396493 RepID=UPI0022FE1262|nr:uncharacterized protein EV422DRAFT_40550 [Fimicolochytrium jonesii]KAI8821389.1 hypothetical protein EV422DRAFT_40550 [Fimicolochytrium jonesii]